MTFDDADNLENVVNVAKENHVSFEWSAAKVRSQLWPWTTESPGKARKPAALIVELPYELFGNRDGGTLLLDIAVNLGGVGARTIEEA
jgi:hypothetical protein